MGGRVAYMAGSEEEPKAGVNWNPKLDRKKIFVNSYKIPDYFERKKLYRTAQQFRELMRLGIFVLVDDKFCIKSDKYIVVDENTFHLSKYANDHLEECCMQFTYEYFIIRKEDTQQIDRVGAHFLFEYNVDILAKSKNSDFVENYLKFYKNTMNIGGGVGGGTTRNFPELLKHYMERNHMTEEQLSEDTGISVRTIQRMRNVDTHYKIGSVIAVCIALHLNPIESNEMILLSGNAFQNTKQDWIYKNLLETAYKQTVYECNWILKSLGFKTLSDM